jgi:cell division protease FtsH
MATNQKTARFNLFYACLAILGVLALRDLWVQSTAVAVVPYSQFQIWLEDGLVKEVLVAADQLEGELYEAVDGKSRFLTTRVDGDLAQQLEDHGVTYSGRVENKLLTTLLSWVLPVLFFVAIWMFLMRRMAAGGGGGSGLMAVGKSKAKVYVESDTKVTFQNVAGVEEAKKELQEIVSFLRDPTGYGRLGARMPKGILLVGPPGTGKTLMARAVAGEAAVPFFSISGSEFVEMFVGVGAARVRDLFEQARGKAPCIIFIDELDAMGRARGSFPGMGGGHDEKEQTLNQLLVELDGFDPMSGIVLLAASNRPEILDPALLRAGRFDRQILLDRPDKNGRAAILTVHISTITLDPELNLDDVAALTPGFTGADLANLVNEAALAATRRDASAVSMQDFDTAVERIVAGLEKRNRLINPLERKVVAHHEMGHALVAAARPTSDPVHKVLIIPRGISALGFTMQRPIEDRYLMTRDELEDRIAVLLGGRAAEELIFGKPSTGAADDLSKATELARSMATLYGMVPELGPVSLDDEPAGFLGPQGGMARHRQHSEQTAREVDCAVRSLLDEGYACARTVLEANRELLERSAIQLLEAETLDEQALALIFEQIQPAGDGAAVENNASPTAGGLGEDAGDLGRRNPPQG